MALSKKWLNLKTRIPHLPVLATTETAYVCLGRASLPRPKCVPPGTTGRYHGHVPIHGVSSQYHQIQSAPEIKKKNISRIYKVLTSKEDKKITFQTG